PASIILPCSALQNGIQLNGSGSSSGPGYSYSWDGPGILSGQNTPVATVNEPGVYALTVSFDTGDGICSKSASINVLPDPLQVMAEATGGEELTCVQKTTMLDGSGSSTGPNVNYNWQPAAGVVSGQGTLMPTVNQPGTYTLTVTHNISGCTATASVTVTQNIAPPTAMAATPGPITCVPGTITLSGQGSSSGPDFSYLWVGPGIVSGANTLNTCVVNAPGVYTLTVTNDVNGCTAKATVNVTQSIVLPDAVANAEAPGALDCITPALTLNSTGSSSGPGIAYTWTTPNGHFAGPVNGPTATVDSLGLYILTVTNTQNGCKNTDTVSVGGNFAPPVIVIKKPVPTLNCAADSVRINAAQSSSGPEFSYVWTTPNGHILSGDSTLMPWVDSAGIYIVSGLNATNGCSAVDTVKIVYDTIPPIVQIALPALLNCLSDTVQLDASGSSFGPRIVRNWTFNPVPGGSGPGFVSGDTTLMPVVNAPGFYTLTLTDTLNFCVSADSVEVLQDTMPPVADAGPDAILSCALQSVLLDGSGSSQGPEFTYLWTGGDTSLQPTVSSPGTYALTVTNSDNGCTTTDSATVTEDENVPDVSIEIPQSLTCVQMQIQLFATASAGPAFVYLWSGPGILAGENTLMPTVGSPGLYTLLVTNTATGCTNEAAVQVVQDIQIPDAALTASGTLNCNTSEVLLMNTSSVDPALLNHVWTNPDGSTGNTDAIPQWPASAPGQYGLLLTNTANGCTTTATVSVIQQGGLSISVTAQTPASCFGAADGALSVSVTGGTGMFNYAWVTGQNTPDLTGLSAGTYTLTVTDSDNCSNTISLEIQQPDLLLANAAATAMSAPGSNDGTAASSPTGGTAPYNFVWSTGQTEPAISGLSAGLYTVTVSDANGCTAEQTVEVTGSNCNLLAGAVAADPACHGQATGSATANTSGGAGPFSYLWSSGATTQTAGDLPAGAYSVTVSDANGCTSEASVTLNEPLLLTIALQNVVNTNCPNSAEGSASVAANGGSGAVTILWNNGQQGTIATNLVAGAYTAVATDANGCTAAVQATIQGNDLVPPVITPGSAPLPVGIAGTVTLTAQNLGLVITDNCEVGAVGFVPTSFDCSQLGIQTVTVTAQDASGNSSTLSFQIMVVDQEPPLVVCPANIRRCADDNVVTYTAPVATDNCLSLGGQFDLIEGLPSGSQYPVGITTTTYTFTDASGNVGSCSFQVEILSPITVALDTILPDVGMQNTGGVQVSVGGSLPGYTFVWQQNGQTVAATEDLAGVAAGTYTLLVTDAFGCTGVAGPFEVSDLVSTADADWSTLVAVYPNPTSGQVFVVLPDELANTDLQISVFDAIGRTAQQLAFGQGQKQIALDWAVFADGVYALVIRTESGIAAWRVVLDR
ncbi:MAG: HYR domain-containing protein, partial [Saprospiraceae bacterium]|nr:HYR domain-containing protein [Saprospiraceae bacterium]